MGTHALVAYKDKETGYVKSRYVHYDGYIRNGVGETIFKHYNTYELAKAVVELGDGSTIEKTLEESAKEAYSARGETNVEACLYTSEEAYLLDAETYEYAYLFKDGKWYILNNVFTNLEDYF